MVTEVQASPLHFHLTSNRTKKIWWRGQACGNNTRTPRVWPYSPSLLPESKGKLSTLFWVQGWGQGWGGGRHRREAFPITMERSVVVFENIKNNRHRMLQLSFWVHIQELKSLLMWVCYGCLLLMALMFVIQTTTGEAPQGACSSEWISKWGTHTMGYYSVLRGREFQNSSIWPCRTSSRTCCSTK